MTPQCLEGEDCQVRYRTARAAWEAMIAATRGVAIDFALGELDARYCRLVKTLLDSMEDLTGFFCEEPIPVTKLLGTWATKGDQATDVED